MTGRSPVPSHASARGGLILWLLAVVFVVTTARSTVAAAAPGTDCQFVLGFRVLHDLIPTIVGDCVTNEMHNPANGDGLQLTTHGLLVWRKADNFTAFTDGYRTWINGPFGLQVRLNNARFPWEPDVAPANVDPRLSVAYHLAASSRFSNRISDFVARRIPVQLATLPDAVFGAFAIDPQTGQTSISVDQSLEGTDPADAAAVLVHESTHAFDFTHQPNFATRQGCIETELRARTNEVVFWRDEFGPNGKQPPTNTFEQLENAQLRLAETDLRALLIATFNTYRTECGL